MTEVQHTDIGQRIFGVPTLVSASFSVLLLTQPHIIQNIQQVHRDHVPAVPPTFHLLGSTPAYYNQGMVRFSPSSPASSDPSTLRLTDIHILTIEGHPDFTQPVMDAIIDNRTASGIIDEETAKDARRRAKWRNDGVIVGEVVWKVLGVQC
jgi:hypothetical protein